MLTQEELKKQLHYDPDTGIFTWIVSNSNRVKVGDIAGSLDAHGYINFQVNGKLYKAHRLAFLYMDGEFPQNDVDHINNIRNDNRWSNIRRATRAENLRNMGKSSRNKSGFKGVHLNKLRGKYAAQCSINGKTIHLGSYLTAEAAFEARTAYAKLHHGEFYKEISS